MKQLFIALIILLVIIGCSQNHSDKRGKKAVLLADREAPLGWIYLRIYQDKSFEFESRGLRTRTVYFGTFKLDSDTLIFHYKDSIPKAGSKAVISNGYVSYIDGEYSESVEIKLNELTK